MQIIGLAAAACVLATFCMRSILALRSFAIASNVLFMVYAAQSNLAPILLLHALVLPINVWSLRTVIGTRATGGLCVGCCIVLGVALWTASASFLHTSGIKTSEGIGIRLWVKIAGSRAS